MRFEKERKRNLRFEKVLLPTRSSLIGGQKDAVLKPCKFEITKPQHFETKKPRTPPTPQHTDSHPMHPTTLLGDTKEHGNVCIFSRYVSSRYVSSLFHWNLSGILSGNLFPSTRHFLASPYLLQEDAQTYKKNPETF